MKKEIKGVIFIRKTVRTNLLRSQIIKRKLLWLVNGFILGLLLHTQLLAAALEIQVGPQGIKGTAKAVPMQTVLEKVTQETGYLIYLDEKLKTIPVTFHIDKYLDPETAIRSMVHPHSYAIVFGKTPEKEQMNILEVKVYSKGETDRTRFIALKSEKPNSPDGRNNSDTEGKTQSSGSGDGNVNSVSSPGGTGRSIVGKNIVRQDYYPKKTMFGPSVMEARDSLKGPDYRPSTMELRKAYNKYMADKKTEQDQVEHATYMEAKMRYEQAKNQSRQKRSQEIRAYEMNEKRNTDINQEPNVK